MSEFRIRSIEEGLIKTYKDIDIRYLKNGFVELTGLDTHMNGIYYVFKKIVDNEKVVSYFVFPKLPEDLVFGIPTEKDYEWNIHRSERKYILKIDKI